MIYKLKEGNIVKVIAPSSYVEDEKEFFNGIEIIKNWGLNVKFNNLTNRKYGYFAGDDNTRFAEIEEAQDSDLIICAKGGWGASRIIEKSPKWIDRWLLGFSDNCSLLLSKYSKGSFGSIHGPTISTLSKEPNWSINRLRTFLFEGYLEDIVGRPLKKGIAKGEILISNLTIFCFLIGTNDMPNCEGKILIFEDVNEDIYKIDRMFTYIRMTQVLKNIVGIGFGNFFDPKRTNQIELLENLIFDRFAEFNVPMISNLPVGHLTGNACLPYGYKGILNGNIGKLSIS